MKKICLFMALALYALACTNTSSTDKETASSQPKIAGTDTEKQSADTSGAGTLDPTDTIPQETVIKMVAHYRELSLDKVEQINLMGPQLRFFMTDVNRLKLIIGAYVDGPKKDQLTVVFQRRIFHGSVPEYRYYDGIKVMHLSKITEDDQLICPPPSNCSIP